MPKLMLFEKQSVLGFMTDFYRDNDGNLYMTSEQIGRCLEYAYPREAINKIYDRFKDRLKKYSVEVKLTSTDGKTYKTRAFSERGIYLIAMKSDQPKAWDFQEAVADILVKLRRGYQVWLLQREVGKVERRRLTDTIRDCVPDSPYKKFAYKNYTDLVYKTALGRNCKSLKDFMGLRKDENLRDKLSEEDLQKVDEIEGVVRALITLDYSYDEIKDILRRRYIK